MLGHQTPVLISRTTGRRLASEWLKPPVRSRGDGLYGLISWVFAQQIYVQMPCVKGRLVLAGAGPNL